MWNVYEGLYAFNFSEGQGAYVVRLCDGTTREVVVKQEDGGKMIIAISILLPMLLSFIIIIGAVSLGKEHSVFKIGLFLLSFIPFFTAMHFTMIGIVTFYEVPALADAIGGTVYWVGLMFGVIVSYFLIYALYVYFSVMAQRKDARFEY